MFKKSGSPEKLNPIKQKEDYNMKPVKIDLSDSDKDKIKKLLIPNIKKDKESLNDK